MRVAMVTPGFSADERDWCIPALHDLVRELASRVDLTVVALRYPHTDRPYGFHGARVVPFGLGQRGRIASLPVLLGAHRWLVAHGRDARLDVVHGLWAGETAGLAVLAARQLGIPSLVSLMGGELADLPESGYGGARLRLPGPFGRLRARVRLRESLASLRAADAVSAGSGFLAELARWRTGIDPLRLPLGVDLARFVPEGPVRSLEGRPAILMVGSLIAVKGHADALQALARLARQSVAPFEPVLHVVGEGPLRASLGAQVEALGLRGNVRFHDEVAHDLLPAYYRGADVCLQASRHESQAMVVLEAGACGRATVGTRVGLLPELVPAPLTAEPAAVDELTLVLSRACRDSDLVADAAHDLQRDVREAFSVEVRTTALVERYALLRAAGAGGTERAGGDERAGSSTCGG